MEKSKSRNRSFPSQEDVRIRDMEQEEADAEKWAEICRKEGHEYDSWGICNRCGKELI